MKAARFLAMAAGSHHSPLPTEPLEDESSHQRSHSRSLSWSPHTRPQANFTPSYYPISSVLMEFVPSLLTTSGQPNDGRSTNLYRNSSYSALPDRVGMSRDGSPLSDDAQRGDVSINMEQELDQRRRHEQAVFENMDQSTLGVEVSEGLRWMERNAVFMIILLIKFSVYHRYGLMIIIGMFITFFQCNQVIRRQVALQDRRKKSILILTVLFLAANISFVYYAFWDKHIYNCLYFLPPQFTIDIANLLWSIWVTDYIIRFATMALKALIASFFIRIIPSSKKGQIYMLLEYGSQLYRNIIPVPLWVRYLSNKKDTGIVVAIIVTATYLMIKGVVIFLSAKDLGKAILSVLKDKLYTRAEHQSQFNSTACPICQEEYHKPVSLKCQHVFCENCVLRWLDRQNSCPLCRCPVSNHNPKWRDGSTSSWPQLF